MITNYYYNEQLRKYILQFAAIFAGMHVATGKGEDGEITLLPCPIRYGSIDRVVGSITNRNTQNTPISVPMMSCYLTDLEMAPERRKGVGFVDRKTVFKEGGVYPDDLEVLERVMPIPYNINMELAVYASNTDQSFQLLEQILMMFDPHLQIQISDESFDWTKITQVELMSVANEENYPMGAEKRMKIWTFNFMIPIYISPPAALKKEVVHRVITRLGAMEGFAIDEVDENGETQPFKELYGTADSDAFKT